MLSVMTRYPNDSFFVRDILLILVHVPETQHTSQSLPALTIHSQQLACNVPALHAEDPVIL